MRNPQNSRNTAAAFASAVVAAAPHTHVAAQCDQWQPLEVGTNQVVNALGVYNGDLIASGQFTQIGGRSAAGIARWNESSGGWQSLGAGLSGVNGPGMGAALAV